ncbi:MAG: acetate--CoA ligase family protein [Rhodospirillales bacterium]|nr:acetate--CoA ligase family protein [Rhodospirillales bacterium]
MNLLEYHAKTGVLGPAGIKVPNGRWCEDPEAAALAAAELGPSVVKAQVPTGHRGKAGGVRMVDTPEQAHAAARELLRITFAGHRATAVLVEERAPVAREFYAAVLYSPRERAPLVMFAAEGGMDIEEVAARGTDTIRRQLVMSPDRFHTADAAAMLDDLGLDHMKPRIADVLTRLYRRYRETDAELIEINPLAELADHTLVALDCKFVLDDAAAFRQPSHLAVAAADPATELESRAAALGLKYIELNGSVGILANGAGLTMTTMDIVRHFGGHPANFLEIGGDAYVKAGSALELVLDNPRVRSLVVNFCGAFARTDVMACGVIEAWQRLKPAIPVFFSVHGTGEEEAVELIKREFAKDPFDLMEDAVRAAVAAAQ